MEKKYIEVYFKVLNINKIEVSYMYVSGPRNTRGLGAALEMKIQKEKIKNINILWWSSWSRILKKCKLGRDGWEGPNFP